MRVSLGSVSVCPALRMRVGQRWILEAFEDRLRSMLQGAIQVVK
jgi:hypothetical protein